MDFPLLIKDLQNKFSKPGKIVAITIRPERVVPVTRVESILAMAKKGLEGDRSKGGNRQVTLIQKEHMDTIASFLGKHSLDFELTRRNLLVEGINLLALKDKKFQIGEAVLEYTGECHPCSRMEQALGPGGYNAMRGHGGITAKIIQGGVLRIGDEVISLI